MGKGFNLLDMGLAARLGVAAAACAVVWLAVGWALG
jgi:hypothetical protein